MGGTISTKGAIYSGDWSNVSITTTQIRDEPWSNNIASLSTNITNLNVTLELERTKINNLNNSVPKLGSYATFTSLNVTSGMLNMTNRNVTDTDCVIFKSGGKICGS
jgi:hypothetical protein